MERMSDMKFFTLNKKPKVYNIAIASVIMLMVLFILYTMNKPDLILASFMVYFVTVLIMLKDAFFKQLKYNPYSYNTIIYSGFFLYVLFMLITVISIMIRIRNGSLANEVEYIIGSILNSSENYMYITFPFLLIFSIGLCISNIVLIRKEGRSIYNILGIILSILLIGGVVILFRYNFYVSGSAKEVFYHDFFGHIFANIYLYFECMMVGTIIANIIVVRHRPDYDKDYLIVLGCGLNKDGTPTPLLKGRVDKALDFYRLQKQVTGKEATFITSGGQGDDEVISESESMRRYLIEQGIDDNRIIKEDKSTSTYENMMFSKEKIESGKVAFCTTNYHVFRSGIFAQMAKLKAEGMGAKTKWYFWPNAAVREFVGLLSRHKYKQIFVFLSILIFSLILSIFKYRLMVG